MKNEKDAEKKIKKASQKKKEKKNKHSRTLSMSSGV